MILEYSYEKAVKVLELLKESKIAMLDIKEDGDKTIMEYKLIEDFPMQLHKRIRRTLTDAMPRRLMLIKLFNDIIVTKATGAEIHFELHFNAVSVKKCQIHYSYEGQLITSSDNDDLTAMKACLDRMDMLLTNMGVSSQKIDAYHKEGGGRNKKYTQLTMKDFVCMVRHALEE